MIPKHCREVGVKRVSFPITESNIMAEAAGKAVYTNINYLVLNNGSDWAVLKVHKSREPRLFQKIERVEIISMPAGLPPKK